MGKPAMHAFLRLVAATILALGVAGCTSVSYYAQSLEGHVNIMTARRDVAKLIDDPSTPETLRARMASARGRTPAKKEGWMARYGAPSANLGDKTPETSDDGEHKLEL